MTKRCGCCNAPLKGSSYRGSSPGRAGVIGGKGSLAIDPTQDPEVIFGDEVGEWASDYLFLQRHTIRSGFLVPESLASQVASRERFAALQVAVASRFDTLVKRSMKPLVKAIREFSEVEAPALSRWSKRTGKKGEAVRGARKVRQTALALRTFERSQLGQALSAATKALGRMGFGKTIRQDDVVIVEPPMPALVYAREKSYGTTISKIWKDARDRGAKLPAAYKGRTKKLLTGIPSISRADGTLTIKAPARPHEAPIMSVVRGTLISAQDAETAYLHGVLNYLYSYYVGQLWTIETLDGFKAAGYDFTDYRSRHAVNPVGRDKESLFSGVTFSMATRSDVDSIAALVDKSKFSAEGREIARSQMLDGIDSQPDEDSEASSDDATSTGAPVLAMFKNGQRAVMFWIGQAGSQYFRYGKSTITLLTETSKMSSPSFGLPAYTPERGGSCPAAAVTDARLARLWGARGRDMLICATCYATGASYGYAPSLTENAARLQWLKQLRAAGGRSHAADVMGYTFAVMIAGYASDAKGSGRKGQELGVWNGSAVVTPSGVATDTPLRLSSVGDESFPTSTRAFFKQRGVPKGAACGFFRLHDSGDFILMPAQIEAWAKVVASLPHVFIWTPTRVWLYQSRGTLEELRADAAAGDVRAKNRLAWVMSWMDGTCNAEPSWTLRRKSGSAARGSAAKMGRDPASLAPGQGKAEDPSLDLLCGKYVLPFAKRIEALAELSSYDNSTVRPSGLYIKEYPDDPVTIPTINGLSAGSGVARKFSPAAYTALKQLRSRTSAAAAQLSAQARKQVAQIQSKAKASETVYPPICSMDTPQRPAVRAYQCPVYTVDAQGKTAKSCQAANCRACWVADELPIFYGAH